MIRYDTTCHTVISHHVTRIGRCHFRFLMTHTIMSFAATTNIIKQQTLSYTDLNLHNHHLPLRNLTTTSIQVALSCIVIMIEASFCTRICNLIANPPALFPSSLSCAFACLMAVNLPAYIYFPLSHFVYELCNVRTKPH
jgi:hypothetical protein